MNPRKITHASTKKLIDHFSVLSLNLRFGLADDGPNCWSNRKDAFPLLLDNYPADFISFQEVNNFQLEFLDQVLVKYNYIGERNPAPTFWQNNIIFHRQNWACLKHDHFYLSPTPDIPSRSRDSRWPRQCTIGHFEKKDREIICINTHFDFDECTQTESAELIMKRLSGMPVEIPAVLMGDFNASPAARCYGTFTGQNAAQGNSETSLFKNVFRKPFPGTYHGFKGEENSGDHIDWILYRGALIPEDKRVIHEPVSGIYPSDHFPLFASFKWEKKGTAN